MEAGDLDLIQLGRILGRRRHWIVAAGVAGAIAAAAVSVVTAPSPEYLASSTVRYEKSSTPIGMFLESVSWSASDEIQTQAAVITSFPVLLGVGRRLGKVPDEAAGRDIWASAAWARELEGLRGQITALRRGDTNLIDIGARADSAAVAADVANAVALSYQEANAKEKNRRVRNARSFIETQLRTTEQRLRAAEEELRAYRERTQILDLQVQMDASLREEERLRLQLQEVETAIGWIQEGRVEGVSDGGTGVLTDPQLTRLAQQLSEVQTRRAALLDYYTPSHPQAAELDEQIRSIQGAIEGRVGMLATHLEKRRTQLRSALTELRARQGGLPSSALELARLERDLRVEEELYGLLKSKYQEALIKESEPIEEVDIIRLAFPPQNPVQRRSPFLAPAAGGFLGVLLTGFWVLGFEAFGTRVEDPTALDRLTGVRLLCQLPADGDSEWPELLRPLAEEDAPAADALRRLRSLLGFDMRDPQLRVLAVAPLEHDEQDRTALALALTLAQAGREVLLVDGWMGAPRLHATLQLPPSPGFSEVVARTVDPREAMRGIADFIMGGLDTQDLLAFPGLERFAVMTSGARPHSPADFLAGADLKSAVGILRDVSQVSVLDVPTLSQPSGALALAPHLDGLLVSCGRGPLSTRSLRDSKGMWEQAGGRFLGAVWKTAPGRPESVSGAARLRRVAWGIALLLTAVSVATSLWVQGRLGGIGGGP